MTYILTVIFSATLEFLAKMALYPFDFGTTTTTKNPYVIYAGDWSERILGNLFHDSN